MAALLSVAAVARAQDKPLREWMQDARSADTRAAALARFRAATPGDLAELKLLVDDARRMPGEGVARMLEDPRKACRGRNADPDAWLGCLVEQLEGKSTVNAKSATAFVCALIGARSAKGIDGYALVAGLELDAKAWYATDDGFYFMPQFGVLLPFSGLNHYKDVVLSDEKFRTAQFAWTGQLFAGVQF